MPDPAILSLATALPEHAIERHASAAATATRCASNDRQARLIHRIHDASTVDHRGSVLLNADPRSTSSPDPLAPFYPATNGQTRGPTTARRMESYAEHAAPLASAACARALRDAGLHPSRITHLITTTCTGFASPGVEHKLVETLALNRSVARVQIGFMGCHAALNALRVAAAIARSEPEARVLLCCVELCSLHFQYGWDTQRIVTNALFADGAAAAVIGATQDHHPSVAGFASYLIKDTSDDMGWVIGDHGFEMTLSPRVPGLIAEHLRPWLDDFLAAHTLSVTDIQGWCIHAGGPRIVSAVAERLNLSDDATAASRAVLQHHGNMSSATVLFILHRLLQTPHTLPCVMLAFGPGLVAEAALLKSSRP